MTHIISYSRNNIITTYFSGADISEIIIEEKFKGMGILLCRSWLRGHLLVLLSNVNIMHFIIAIINFLFVAKKLNILNVQKALKNVPSDKYVHVGLVLGVELKEIKKIEANFPRDVERVWMEILQCWLDSSSTHTWTSLAITLIENDLSHFTEFFEVV